MSDLSFTLAEFGEITGLTVWLVIKFGMAFGLMIYLGFAVMIVRQVELMSRSLNGTFKKPLKTVAWGYFIATIMTLIAILVFL